jgi:DNA-binding transcriptional regulator YiaG
MRKRLGSEPVRDLPGRNRSHDPVRWVRLIGARIRAAREERGLSRFELARASGISFASIASWETGRAAPAAIKLFQLGLALKTDPREFLP